MKLNKPIKTIAGLATLMYAAYPFLFFGVWLFMMFGMVTTASSSNNELPAFFIFPFLLIFPLQFCFLFLHFGLNIFYLIHIIKNTDGNETVRIILAIGNFFLPFFSMPIYFYLYIWTENPPGWALAKPAQPSAN